MALNILIQRSLDLFSRASDSLLSSPPILTTTLIFLSLTILTLTLSIQLLSTDPLSKIPGPRLYALTKWRLAYDDYLGLRTRRIHNLHQLYGPAIRLGPNELSFNSLSALKSIYGAGSGFERTSFYRMFDVYGEQNLFTFAGVKEHGERKKLLNHAYSKSSILKNSASCVEERVKEFMDLVEREPDVAGEIFGSLHYYALDNITNFLYGAFGGTSALLGKGADREMLRDVLDPDRRKLAWFAAHLPRYTKWLMSSTGVVGRLVEALGMLPQRKPTVYTGIRKHALQASENFSASDEGIKAASKNTTIIGKLWPHHVSQKSDGLTSMKAASEAADHLLAGVDTTSDTLLFLIWALSLPENAHFQEKLIHEVSQISASDLNSHGLLTVEATSKLLYLDAVLKETLRLYSPLPASEPRSLPVDTTIDGYLIPANTIVSMSPYTLHRNSKVFKDPLAFDPERWLGDEESVKEMNRWFWAFSSGGRMCIGIHLAMAEMTALTAAIYQRYITKVREGTEETSPGVTSRFEVFYDKLKPRMKEHECWINFAKR